MNRFHPIYQCKCGIKFANEIELRTHIALLTPQWPKVTCTHDHYDRKNPRHREYLARVECSATQREE